MRNIKSSQIIEGLSYNRSGKIDESISKRVKGDLENYWKTQKTPSSVRKMINNLVNYTYSTCTHISECEIKKLARNSEEVYEGSNIRFQFAENTDVDSIMKTLSESIRVEMGKNYSEFLTEGNSTVLTIDHVNEGGYSVVLEKVDDCIEMFICHMKEQIHEGVKPVQSIKYFKGKNPWDRFTFIFTPFRGKDGNMKIKVSMENTYWDSSDYAFIDANKPLLKTMTSYSDMAVKKVRDALRVAEYTDKDFEDIKAELHMDEGLTGALGTEVGLPIDKENCESVEKTNESKENESTDVSGVATPTGKLTDKEGVEDNLEEEGLVCPECGSADINTRDDELLCAQCGYAWKDDNGDGEENSKEEVDLMITNDEDEKPLKTFDIDAKAPLAKEMTSSTQGVHEEVELEDVIVEGLSKTASGLRDGLMKVISRLGEVEYNGESYVEISTKKSPKQIITDIDTFFKKNGFDTEPNIKEYRIEVAGDDMFYMLVTVNKTGDTTRIDYDIAM